MNGGTKCRAKLGTPLVIAALCHASFANANDVPIAVPNQAPRFAPKNIQCQFDYDAVWNAKFAKIHALAADLERSANDFRARRAELLNDRIWFGLGPPANSDAARTIAISLRGLQLAGKGAEIALKSMPAKGPWVEAYKTIKNADHWWKIQSTKSLVDFILLSKEFILDPWIKGLATIGETIAKGIKTDEDWKRLKSDTERQIAQIDSDIQKTQEILNRVERKLHDEAVAEFKKVCVDDGSPVAVDDAYQLVGGMIGDFPVLANDSDPDGGSIRVMDVKTLNTTVGSATVSTLSSPAGTVRYQAPDDYEGEVHLSYTIIDEEGARALARIVIVVTRETKDTAEPPILPSRPSTGASSGVKGIGVRNTRDSDAPRTNSERLESIWKACRQSPQIQDCVDRALAGENVGIETGRVHLGCSGAIEHIRSLRADLDAAQQELQQLEVNESLDPLGDRRRSLRRTIDADRGWIERARREAIENFGCRL